MGSKQFPKETKYIHSFILSNIVGYETTFA